jgi:hypothetical protein
MQRPAQTSDDYAPDCKFVFHELHPFDKNVLPVVSATLAPIRLS